MNCANNNIIIIFDTYGGLCNQFHDINCGINFCIINNIKFSFRYCSFRNQNLTSWYNEKIEKLFDVTFLKKYHDLYVNIDDLYITNENTFNFNSNLVNTFLTHDNLKIIFTVNKKFIILKQFCTVYINNIKNVYPYILPSNRIMDIYNKIKNQIINNNDQYNFIHYRYEKDFVDHFKVKIQNLKPLILETKQKFKNPNLKIYIATSNIKKLIDINDIELCNIILFKNEDELTNYNFEECAFIDYMFGLNSNELFGHSNSSFSHMLNNMKNTSNLYN